MSNDLRNVDVAIVGGGIVGCAVALAARRAGLTAAILERGRICGEASSVAAGLICGQYDADGDSPLVRLRLAGRDGFPEFAELLESLGGAPVGYLPGPTMGVALTDDERERLLARVAAQREAGFDVEFLEPDEARRREPVLAPDVTGAAIYPDGQVDTHRWGPIVHRAVLAAGVDVHLGSEVVAISGGANATVRTVRGIVSADHVVLATGPWARELLPWVPVVPVQRAHHHVRGAQSPHAPRRPQARRHAEPAIRWAPDLRRHQGARRFRPAGAGGRDRVAAPRRHGGGPRVGGRNADGNSDGIPSGFRGRAAADRARFSERGDAGHRPPHAWRHDELADGTDRGSAALQPGS